MLWGRVGAGEVCDVEAERDVSANYHSPVMTRRHGQARGWRRGQTSARHVPRSYPLHTTAVPMGLSISTGAYPHAWQFKVCTMYLGGGSVQCSSVRCRSVRCSSVQCQCSVPVFSTAVFSAAVVDDRQISKQLTFPAAVPPADLEGSGSTYAGLVASDSVPQNRVSGNLWGSRPEPAPHWPPAFGTSF